MGPPLPLPPFGLGPGPRQVRLGGPGARGRAAAHAPWGKMAPAGRGCCCSCCCSGSAAASAGAARRALVLLLGVLSAAPRPAALATEHYSPLSLLKQEAPAGGGCSPQAGDWGDQYSAECGGEWAAAGGRPGPRDRLAGRPGVPPGRFPPPALTLFVLAGGRPGEGSEWRKLTARSWPGRPSEGRRRWRAVPGSPCSRGGSEGGTDGRGVPGPIQVWESGGQTARV